MNYVIKNLTECGNCTHCGHPLDVGEKAWEGELPETDSELFCGSYCERLHARWLKEQLAESAHRKEARREDEDDEMDEMGARESEGRLFGDDEDLPDLGGSVRRRRGNERHLPRRAGAHRYRSRHVATGTKRL
jgi:hypothetical protein